MDMIDNKNNRNSEDALTIEATIKKQHERDAARVNLRKMLETKKRGDRITAAEIVTATGFENWQSFGATIRSFIRSAGLVAFPVTNDGWRVGLPVDHLDYAERQRRGALRREKRGLDALVHAPRAELDDDQTRRAEFLLARSAARVQTAKQHDKETRTEFKLGRERVPLRIAGGKKEPGEE